MNEFTTVESRDWLKNVLHTTADVTVVFTKVDGTERTMHCTLKQDEIGSYEKKTDKVRALNPDVVRVWDVEKNEWRSFRYDAIRSVAFEL